MLELEREGGIVDRLLDRLSRRRTFVLEEPIAASIRRRRGFEYIEFQVPMPSDVSEEEIKAFVRMWARRLAEGWAEKFTPPGLSREDIEQWVEAMTNEIIRGAVRKAAAALPPPPPPPRRRRATARAVPAEEAESSGESGSAEASVKT